MDMSSMTMSMTMDMSSTTTTASASSPTTTAAMSMDMGGESACKISMLWNWYTIDTCFLASSWHNTTTGMFAGSCIGVLLLTMSLELMRRTVKEYDRYLVKKHTSAAAFESSAPGDNGNKPATTAGPGPSCQSAAQPQRFRPSVLEQATRALLHMVQFAIAYFIMLLAMYYNGYIIICIFIGSYLGAFIFHWEPLDIGRGTTSATQEPTVCCG